MSDALRRFKSEIFQGLAHPTRIAIVELLREGEPNLAALKDASSRRGRCAPKASWAKASRIYVYPGYLRTQPMAKWIVEAAPVLSAPGAAEIGAQ